VRATSTLFEVFRVTVVTSGHACSDKLVTQNQARQGRLELLTELETGMEHGVRDSLDRLAELVAKEG
jgi:hypothetical protein